MERSNGRKKNTMLRAAGVLFALVLATTWMTTGLLARYVVTASGTDEARVAAFVFRVKDKETSKTIQVSLNEVKAPGDQAVYTFEVTNVDGKTCEVAQEYDVTMTLDGSLPLKCTLVRDSGSKNGAAAQSVDALAAGTTMPATTTAITGDFAAAEASTDTYTLTVEWPQTANDPMYAYGAAALELTVRSEQID